MSHVEWIMESFCTYDLLVKKGKSLGLDEHGLRKSLLSKGIRAKDIDCLKKGARYPDDSLVMIKVLEYLDMSLLEFNLSLGIIPTAYQASFEDNIRNISALLAPDQLPLSKSCSPLPVYETENGALYSGDCLEIMPTIPENSFDLIFADPPFNLNKEYDEGVDDDLMPSHYISWTHRWLDQCIRLLKPGGYLCVYNLPKWCTYIATYLNQYLTFWDWIAVDMKYSLPISRRLYPAHYGLVVYVKGPKPTVYNNQRIPLDTCRHCGGEMKDYGGYKSKMNPEGVNVSDVWSDIYPVRHTGSKNRRYNELPIKLLDRVIRMTTNEGDSVFDPFGGSGTTYAASELLGRRWVGTELGNCDVIITRLQSPDRDAEKIATLEKDRCLFPESIRKLREKNGFWLPEDFGDVK